jgi:hypothetical protein
MVTLRHFSQKKKILCRIGAAPFLLSPSAKISPKKRNWYPGPALVFLVVFKLETVKNK